MICKGCLVGSLPQSITICISVDVTVAGDDDGEKEEEEEDPGDEKAWRPPCSRHPVTVCHSVSVMASLGGNLTTQHFLRERKLVSRRERDLSELSVAFQILHRQSHNISS